MGNFSKLMTRSFLKDRALISTMRYIGRERRPFLTNTGDYVRVSSLELVADEIYDDATNRKGAVAELGVYQGEFAKIINESFPDRKLYLFDTFEGFDSKEKVSEKERGFSQGNQDFSDTSAELVLSKMKYPENCVIKKGYFPDTAKDLNETFVFVSIDTDLYDPIYNGPCIFL